MFLDDPTKMNLVLLQSALTFFESQFSHSLNYQVNNHGFWIAQFEDNLGSSFQGAWDNFIQSGQVWALLVGFIVGYLFRSITSY